MRVTGLNLVLGLLAACLAHTLTEHTSYDQIFFDPWGGKRVREEWSETMWLKLLRINPPLFLFDFDFDFSFSLLHFWIPKKNFLGRHQHRRIAAVCHWNVSRDEYSPGRTAYSLIIPQISWIAFDIPQILLRCMNVFKFLSVPTHLLLLFRLILLRCGLHQPPLNVTAVTDACNPDTSPWDKIMPK